MDQHSKVKPLGSPAELHIVLSRVLDQVNPEASGLDYRLVGTSAALAQGVRLPTGDIDILVPSRDGVEGFATTLSGFPCSVPPTWLPDARQYFTRFQVDQIDVEISTAEWPADTDTFECFGPGPWEHYVHIQIGTHVVPVVSLELRLVTELVRDRPDRYTPLIQHMQLHGTDTQFLVRAMRERALNPALQGRVLDQLRHRPRAGQPSNGDSPG